MYVYICILNPHVQLKIEADHFFFFLLKGMKSAYSVFILMYSL